MAETQAQQAATAPNTPQLLDGAALAARVRRDLSVRVDRLRASGTVPGLGTILVGDDPASATYVNLKHQDCAEVGIRSVGIHLPATASQSEVQAAIQRFNDDPGVHAFLGQIPLPRGLDEQAALYAMNPDKDVDGLHPVNLGRLAMGA